MTMNYDFRLTVEVPDDYHPPDAEAIQKVLAEHHGAIHPDISFTVEEVDS
jgi:hypothetical protein